MTNGLDTVEVFGIIAITTMVVAYALEKRGRVFIVIFAIGCAMAASYAYLIGSYPFMIAEAIWSAVAFWRWYSVGKSEASLR